MTELTPTWYLLFRGDSVDGTGEGDYIGRTTKKTEAIKHFRSIAKHFHAVGHVLVVTDLKQFRLFRESELDEL